MPTFYIVPSPYDAQHHGVLGMKWGIRRYQNKDGTLTPEGRRRLGYDKLGSEDSVIKKGTRSTRVVHDTWNDSRDLIKKNYEKNPELFEKNPDLKRRLMSPEDLEKEMETKYVSVDNFKDNGKENGEEFYVNWFTDGGLEVNGNYVDDYIFKTDIKVANGQKVMDQIIKEVGNKTIESYLKDKHKDVYEELAMKYTTDTNLHNAVNNHFKNIGYDAIEDINDIDTEMPILVLNAKNSMQLKGHKTAEKWLEDHFIDRNTKGYRR